MPIHSDTKKPWLCRIRPIVEHLSGLEKREMFPTCGLIIDDWDFLSTSLDWSNTKNSMSKYKNISVATQEMNVRRRHHVLAQHANFPWGLLVYRRVWA